jgi:ABC-type sulfate transport system permease component
MSRAAAPEMTAVAGATPMKMVVLPIAVFLEAQVGRLHAAIVVSLVVVSLVALVLTRFLGLRGSGAV